MPITITPPAPWNVLGYGSLLSWSTSLGVITNQDWHFDLSTNSDFTAPFWHFVKPAPLVFDGWTVGDILTTQTFPSFSSDTTRQIQDGSNVYVRVRLQDNFSPFNVNDTGTLTIAWQNMANQQVQLQNQISAYGGAGRGLSSAQSTLLTDTKNNTDSILAGITATVHTALGDVEHLLKDFFSGPTLDRFTISEVTSGPTAGPVNATIALWFTGVIVRVTTIPDSFTPLTPDGTWYPQDLASLRVFRGVDQIFREGIHTPTYEKMNPWQWGWGILNFVPLLGVPFDTVIEVSFAFGCQGQVYLMTLP